MSEESRIPLTNNLIQAIGDYLITRPYKEVAILIGNLQTEVQSAMSNKPNGSQRPVSEEQDRSSGELQ
jgi:hypothetical protein